MIKLKLLFKNKTIYSKDVYESFLEFHRKKYSFRYKLYNLFMIFVILACIIFLISYKHFSTAIIFCIILTGFIFWRFLKPVYDVNKEFKSGKISDSHTFTFKFYNDYFTIEDNKIVSKVRYNQLYKFFDNRNFYYLYIDKNHSFLIDKSGFIKGTSNEFKKFIKSKYKLHRFW